MSENPGVSDGEIDKKIHGVVYPSTEGQLMQVYKLKSPKKRKVIKTKTKGKTLKSVDEIKEDCVPENSEVEGQVIVLTEDPSKANETLKLEEKEKIGDGPKFMENGEEVTYKTPQDFDKLNKYSTILLDNKKDKAPIENKVFLTKNERKCLEDITSLASKTRAPLDDRQMTYFSKDYDKFQVEVEIPEKVNASSKEIVDVAVALKESPSNIMTTDLNILVNYLSNLKALIAKREITWAEVAENEYAQKAEIARLKTEVDHLRVISSKRQNEIKDKVKIIQEKDEELNKAQKIIQKMKSKILQMEKLESVTDSPISSQNEATKGYYKQMKDSPVKKTRLQMVEEMLMNEKTNKTPGNSSANQPTTDLRKNQGPAALMANALYRARTAGNFVNF